MIITIDGPVASGKSTVARILAEKLRFFYLSSGLLYRATAYCLQKECNYSLVQMRDPDMKDIHHCLGLTQVISYHYDQHGAHIFLHDKEITAELKNVFIDKAASLIAQNPIIRKQLLDLQRKIAQGHDIVVEGRDIGSTIFPQAEVKFYLTASLEVRAARWQHDQEKKGAIFSTQEAEKNVKERDVRDKERKIAPLIIPEGAIYIDNSNMDVDETIEWMMDEIKNRS